MGTHDRGPDAHRGVEQAIYVVASTDIGAYPTGTDIETILAFLDSELNRLESTYIRFGSFLSDANFFATITNGLASDSTFFGSRFGSFTGDAYAVWTYLSSLTADANLFKTVTGSFSADAYADYLKIYADAVLHAVRTGDVSAAAWLVQRYLGSLSADAVVKRTMGGTPYADLVLGAGAVSYWKLNESAGTLAEDSAGSMDGTYTGSVTYGVAGPSQIAGTAISLPGSDASFVNTAQPWDLPWGNFDRTIEAWFKTSKTTQQVIFGYGEPGTRRQFVVMLNYAGADLCVSTYGDDGGVNVSNEEADNQWHHLAVTYTGATLTLEFWLDGVSRGTRVVGLALDTRVYDTGSDIGRLYYTNGWPWSGSLAHIAVYPTVLSQATIEAHAAGDVSGFGFTADAFIPDEGTKYGTFDADATVFKTMLGSATADAIVRAQIESAFYSDAILRTVQQGSFLADASVLGGFVGAIDADSVLLATVLDSLTADSTILAAVPGSFSADSGVDPVWDDWSETWSNPTGGGGSIDADAVILGVVAGSIDADAVVLAAVAGSVDADAVVLATIEQTFTADASLVSGGSGDFTADAVIEKTSTFGEVPALQVDAVSYNTGEVIVDSWTHTPVASSLQGVVVLISHANAPQRVTGVTYGGQAMTLIRTDAKPNGKQSRSYIYWLGSNIPTGAQTVTVSGTNDSGHVSVLSLTAGGPLALLDSDGTNGTTTGTVTLPMTYGGEFGMTFVSAGFGTYYATPTIANHTQVLYSGHFNGHDYHARQTTAGTSDFSGGLALHPSTSSDYCLSVAAFGYGAPLVDGAGPTADAVIFATATETFTTDAWVQPTFTADAYIHPYFTADAVIFATTTDTLTADAWVQPTFTADAVIKATIESSADSGSVTITELTAWSATSGSSQVSPSVSPADNSLIVLFSDVITRDTSNVTGLGLTWTRVDFQPWWNDDSREVSCWVAQGTVTPGTVTVTLTGTTSGFVGHILQAVGAVDTGTALDAVVQSAKNKTNSGTQLIVTFASAYQSKSAAVVGFGLGSTGYNAEAGWTSGTKLTAGYANSGLPIWQNEATDTTPYVAKSTPTSLAGGVGIEIAAQPGGFTADAYIQPSFTADASIYDPAGGDARVSHLVGEVAVGGMVSDAQVSHLVTEVGIGGMVSDAQVSHIVVEVALPNRYFTADAVVKATVSPTGFTADADISS